MRRALLTLLSLALIPLGASAQQVLTLEFSDMTPHVGQRMGIRVVNSTSGAEAANVTILSIPSAAFTQEIMCLEAGQTYSVDFYADLNGNGMYDAPPMDHAWRRSVEGGSDQTIQFTHVLEFTDIAYPNVAPPFPNLVTSNWEGEWHNITFDSRGDATAMMTMNYEEGTMSGDITTEGAFGNPQPITISGTGPFDPVADSATTTVDDPVPGTITYIRGVLTGELTSELGVTLALNGHYGADQMAFTYEMTGAFQANGTFLMKRTTTTGVSEEDAMMSNAIVAPQPATVTLQITGIAVATPYSVVLTSLAGQEIPVAKTSLVPDGVMLDVATIPSGVYIMSIQDASGVRTTPILIGAR